VDVDELRDPVTFARKILRFEPFPYQVQLLRDPSKRIVVCAGRQVGKSTTIAAKAIHFAVTNPRTTTLIVSPTLRQSMLMFDKIIDFIENSPLRRSVRYKSRTRIRFSNGSWVVALPCGRYGHTLRGFTAHLIILDEAAFIPVEVIENVVFPMLATTDGACWMLSTPWGTDHTFYRAWNSPDWSKHHWPTSANPLVKPEFLEEQRRLIGEERFRIEYLAEFVADEDSFFPITLLRSAIDYDYQPHLEPSLIWGYDPGGKDSMAAFVAIKWEGDRARVMYWRALKSESYVATDLMLRELHAQYPFARLYFDKTGIGNVIEEHLRELGIPSEGVTITAERAQEMMFNLKTLLETKRLLLPPNAIDLMNHLNAIVAEKRWSGRHVFKKREGTYDDLAYALALAVSQPRRRETVGLAIGPQF
jgi:hypothetical protein